MNRKEMERILEAIVSLMGLLLPYVNEPERERWTDMLGEISAIVFTTNEEY